MLHQNCMTQSRMGGKFGKRHSSMTSQAVLVADAVVKMPEVKRVIHGVITPIRSATSRIKFTEIPVGLKVSVYGKTAVQELFIYTADVKKVKQTLSSLF